MRNISSKRAKALAIPQKVRQSVWERDKGKCLWTGVDVDVSCSNAHFIRRSKGGLGIEQNILTLSPEAHRRFDQGTKAEHDEMYDYFRLYLMAYYADWRWSEDKLRYRKDNTYEL